jgi:methyl-accepting chemotaxis protein
MKFGMCILRVSASPIIDPSGKRLGTVVEWGDRTQEIAVQNEVQNVVADMLKGNLERRIALGGKQGFLRDLSTGINGLVDNVAAVVTEVQALVKAVNGGNLEQRIHTEGKSGLMVKLGSGINDLTSNVAEVVDQVQGLVRAANEGDLDRRIQTEGKSGLLVKMAGGINQLTADMAGMVSQVKAAAGEVHRGAEEITTGNITLSQRMEEQASSLEETASSMEEMTSTVKQNADNAGQANQLAMAARDQAEKGGAVVSRAVQAMAEINNASRRIADIISVIDEIAFQTNLLALNAAVEAARAGEQGRGFAVVATEVRNLAGRSATAAKEIKALIQDSVQKVQDGSMLVTQSGVTLEQIVASVKKVTDIVAEIAAASGEQSAGIEQVNKAVMQLDDLTQQNAALVEQASAASQSMTGQARGLNELMRHYKVAATGRPVVPKPAAPAADMADAMDSAAATGTDGAVWREF